MTEALERWLTPVLAELMATFRVLIVQGARQVGKSTLVQALATSHAAAMIDLDDPFQLDTFRHDPGGVLAPLRRPIVIDEIQRAGQPALLAVKRAVDRDQRPGQFVLTGSANYLAARTHVETLAGRNVKVALWPFSQGELAQQRERFVGLAFSDPAALLDVRAPSGGLVLRDRIVAGGFPEVALRLETSAARWRWCAGYAADCTDREALRGIADVRKTDDLRRTLAVLAARTGSELVLQNVRTSLGDAGSSVDHKTLASFVDLLEALHLVHRLPAWSTNLTTRARRHPKIHACDTGLAVGLLRVDADRARTDAVTGQLAETFVVNEIAKQVSWADEPFALFHFRDHEHEIDLLLERSDGSIIGVEVKAGPAQRHDARHLAWLRDTHPQRFVAGFVLHGGTTRQPLGDRLFALPIDALWT